jgi:hypothetical protein
MNVFNRFIYWQFRQVSRFVPKGTRPWGDWEKELRLKEMRTMR